jgi:PP-loop superfamily ATP-utilizing enzyme
LGRVDLGGSNGVQDGTAGPLAFREAADVLGDRALSVMADSPSYPVRHREFARRIARDFSLRHEFIVTPDDDVARPEL